MRFDLASAFYLWILNEVKAMQVNTITSVMPIIPKPRDQQSGSFVAEVQIRRVTFSSVPTLSIFWGRKGGSSQWQRLYLPSLPCAKNRKPGRNPDVYVFLVLWVAVWMAFVIAVWSDRRQCVTNFSIVVTIAWWGFVFWDFFSHHTLYVLSIVRTAHLFFHPFIWRNLAADCWVLQVCLIMWAVLAAVSYDFSVWSERLKKSLGDN